MSFLLTGVNPEEVSMPFMDEKESKKWGKYRPNCSKCGRFVGVGGYFDLDYGEDGNRSPTVDLVLCKKHAEMEMGGEVNNDKR